MFRKTPFKHNPVEKLTLTRQDRPEGRQYVLPDGTAYPSVTTFLGWKDKKFWEEWRESNPGVCENACARGSALHSTIETYLSNETPKDPCFLFKVIKPTLMKIDNILAQEVPLYSSELRLAGTTDCVGDFDGQLSVIDFKSSKKQKKTLWIDNYFIQITAYAIMWNEHYSQKLKNGIVIIAADDLSCDVFKINIEDWIPKLKERLKEYDEHRNK